MDTAWPPANRKPALAFLLPTAKYDVARAALPPAADAPPPSTTFVEVKALPEAA